MKEQAIEYFKFYRKIFCEDHLKICPKDSIAYQATLKEKEFYDMAIKALEQEPVLDQIKSIVAEWKKDTWTDNLSYECMIKIAEIIDKAESEEEK